MAKKAIQASSIDALLDNADLDPKVLSAPEDEPTFPSLADKPALPTTAAQVRKMDSEALDALVDAHSMAVTDFMGASTKEKQAKVIAYLKLDPKSKAVVVEGPSKPAAEVKPAKAKANAEPEISDPILKTAQTIEKLTDQGAIEDEIAVLLENSGMNEFRLGGLLLRLMEEGKFPNNASFKEYIYEKWELGYRVALNFVEIYNGMLKNGVTWEQVKGIGWSKIHPILKVMTPETAADWIAKAKAYNKETLLAAVKAAKEAPVGEDGLKVEQPVNTLKTINFQVGPDQEELIKAAIEEALKQTGNDHKGGALELICTEYLGVGVIKKGGKLQPKTIFEGFLQQAQGDVEAALNAIFGEEFDAVFPNVEVNLKITTPE